MRYAQAREVIESLADEPFAVTPLKRDSTGWVARFRVGGLLYTLGLHKKRLAWDLTLEVDLQPAWHSIVANTGLVRRMLATVVNFVREVRSRKPFERMFLLVQERGRFNLYVRLAKTLADELGFVIKHAQQPTTSRDGTIVLDFAPGLGAVGFEFDQTAFAHELNRAVENNEQRMRDWADEAIVHAQDMLYEVESAYEELEVEGGANRDDLDAAYDDVQNARADLERAELVLDDRHSAIDEFAKRIRRDARGWAELMQQHLDRVPTIIYAVNDTMRAQYELMTRRAFMTEYEPQPDKFERYEGVNAWRIFVDWLKLQGVNL